MERPKLKRDWEGLHVILNVDTQNNGGRKFKAGTAMRVRRNFGGLHLEMLKRCPHCEGETVQSIKGVSEHAVTIIDKTTANSKRALMLAERKVLNAARVYAMLTESKEGNIIALRDLHEAALHYRQLVNSETLP